MCKRLQQGDVGSHVTVTMSDGAAISLRRWGRERERRLILSHGNGLAADGLWAFGQALLDEFEVIVFDMRNHGQSACVAQDDMPWPRYIADIPEIFDAITTHFGVCETHGAFHSMSSACTLIAQVATPRPWRSLTLFEPPVPPPSHPQWVREFASAQEMMAEYTLKRRRLFSDPQELAQSFARSPTFSGIEADSMLDLARATLRAVDHGWELACAPEVEAANFVTATQLADYWSGLARIDVPVQIILGDKAVHNMPLLAEFGQLMGEVFGFSTHICQHSNHFMQMQHPHFCAERVIAFAHEQSG